MQLKSNQPNRPKLDSVELALEQVGDRWTFLVLREAFFGERRFDGFLTATGVSRNILSDRLKKLVSFDILTRSTYGNHPNRFEYKLTEKGLALFPVIVMLMRWGDQWVNTQDEPPLRLVHKHCGTEVHTEMRCHNCDQTLTARDITWHSTSDVS